MVPTTSARTFTLILASVALLAHGDAAPAADSLPEAWRAAWAAPAAVHRPLQIVHGVPPKNATVDRMRSYRDLGLGGVVTNVNFNGYLSSEENFKTLAAAVDACRQLGMVVWLYDEQGYPSGAAGGLVLKRDRSLEASALFYEPGAAEPFRVGPVFEFTHASNNVYACRRYVNLLDPRATEAFVDLTHEAYRKRLGEHLGKTVAATFTDEPSLMAVYLGKIPPNAARHVRVDDPIDPAAKPLPCVPWTADLPEQYRRRYGDDLLAVRRSLFEGEAEADQAVRRRFWSLVGDLVAERYYGRLQKWCRGQGVASSGHTLHEESLIHHVPLDGNKLNVLMRMDVPGLDMLSSDPRTVLSSGWLTAGLPYSAALLNGGRRVMTEISDYSQKVRDKGQATLADMRAAAAWQAAWGVTEFTLYYSIKDRPPEQHRAYCDYVGRLNAVLRDARPEPRVLLYYPIRDLWSEYRPVGQPLTLESQGARAKQVIGSFQRMGRLLQAAQVPFMLVDHEQLAAAKVKDGGLELAGRTFSAVVLPDGCGLPPEVDAVRRAGGRWLASAALQKVSGEALRKDLGVEDGPVPASPDLVTGAFTRDGRRITLLVNVGDKPWAGAIPRGKDRPCVRLDPASGAIAPAEPAGPDAVKAQLAPKEAALWVSQP